jgi:transposase
VEALLGRGHSAHVVYEACGFRLSLYRQLIAAGDHCHVIAPRKLDEERSRVKTDPRDATRLCQRLSRYLEGNTRELALIRVPSEEEEQARLERGVRPGPNLVRSARAARTVALDWTAPTFRFQLDGISHIALPKPKGTRG